jgi:hypothetical protein
MPARARQAAATHPSRLYATRLAGTASKCTSSGGSGRWSDFPKAGAGAAQLRRSAAAV